MTAQVILDNAGRPALIPGCSRGPAWYGAIVGTAGLVFGGIALWRTRHRRDYDDYDGDYGRGRGRGRGRGYDCDRDELLAENAELRGKIYTDHKFGRAMERDCDIEKCVAIQGVKLKDAFEDMREGDAAVKAYCDCHFARTRKAIPACEVVKFNCGCDCDHGDKDRGHREHGKRD